MFWSTLLNSEVGYIPRDVKNDTTRSFVITWCDSWVNKSFILGRNSVTSCACRLDRAFCMCIVSLLQGLSTWPDELVVLVDVFCLAIVSLNTRLWRKILSSNSLKSRFPFVSNLQLINTSCTTSLPKVKPRSAIADRKSDEWITLVFLTSRRMSIPRIVSPIAKSDGMIVKVVSQSTYSAR